MKSGMVYTECEKRFVEAFFDHDDWEPQPGPYYLSNDTKYTPDFKDNKRGVLIEVVGTRQAFHNNKDKYEMFSREYPNLTLEFRAEDGRELHPRSGHLFSEPKDIPQGINNSERIRNAIRKINSAGITQAEAAKKCHYSAQHFCQIIRAVREDRPICPKAELLITAYAEKLA